MGRWIAPLLAVCALALAGCGSVRNLTNQTSMKVYGGTRMDCLDWLGAGSSQNDQFGAMFVWPFWLMDKPLCLAGDTVTLPVVLAWQCLSPECRARDSFWDLFRLPDAAPKPKESPPAEETEKPAGATQS